MKAWLKHSADMWQCNSDSFEVCTAAEIKMKGKGKWFKGCVINFFWSCSSVRGCRQRWCTECTNPKHQIRFKFVEDHWKRNSNWFLCKDIAFCLINILISFSSIEGHRKSIMLGVCYNLRLDTGKQKNVGQSRITTPTTSMPQFLAIVLGGWASYFQVCCLEAWLLEHYIRTSVD